MKKPTLYKTLTLAVAMLLLGFSGWGQTTNRFNDGYLTAFRVTSTAALANTGTAIVMDEYHPTAANQIAPNFNVALPSSGSVLGANDIVVSGTATASGQISRSESGRFILIPGYNALIGAANTTFNTNSVVRIVSGVGTMAAGIAGANYSTGNNNLRGATSDDGSNFWMTGNGVGVVHTTLSAPTTLTTVSITSTNNRAAYIYNGQLYLTTGAGSQGIYSVGTGKPTNTGNTSTRLFAPTNTDVYGFSISPDGLTIYYIAATSGGIYRSVFTSSWSAGTLITSGFTGGAGLAVDWTGYSFNETGANGAVIYATNPTTLSRGTDNGNQGMTLTTLRTLTGNNAFRGLAFSPIQQTIKIGANTPAVSNINTGVNNVVLGQLKLEANEGNSTLKRMVVNNSGTATISTSGSTDITSLRLFGDINGNGIVDGPDAEVSTGAISGSNITFSGITINYIAEGSSRNYLIVGNVSESATVGRTFVPNIQSTTTINNIGYTNNVVNASGSLVTMGTGSDAPTGNTLTIASSSTKYAVTFYVDMTNAGSFTTVDIAGSFNNWGSPVQNLTLVQNNIYTFTTGAVFDPSQTISFKFRKDGNWGTAEPNPDRTYTVVAGTNVYHAVYGVMVAAQVSWANLQWPHTESIGSGDAFNVYGRVYAQGLTGTQGAAPNLNAWVGYSTTNTNPATWTNWVAASYNADAGHNEEYLANIGPGIASPGTYYYATRFKLGLADFVYGGYSSGGGGIWDGSTFTSGVVTVSTPEPTNHATAFVATGGSITSTSIPLTWTDAVPAANAYLVVGVAGHCSSIANPVDGVAQANGPLVQNVAAGVQTHTFTGLTPSTEYCFKIFAYNGTGTNINYKTDGTVPQVSATTLAPAINTYTWIAAGSGSWVVASNWNPERTTPQTTDIMQFNGGGTPTVTAVPAQTIGRLLVTNNTEVTLQAGAANTLTVAGGTGTDLEVEAGSRLTVSGSNALQISLSAGATGSISGSVALAAAAHRLLSASTGGIVFNSGGRFIAGESFSGNPFGTTSLNSVVFASGSTYEFLGGANPFGAGQPSSVVVFQTGSTYIHRSATAAPAFSGRTYANFEYDNAGTIAPSGTAAVSIDNLRIRQGTMNFNMTATPGHSIKGNIEVLQGATLSFSPASAGTVNLNGSSLQTISGGGAILANSNSTIVVNNASGVSLEQSATLNNPSINLGSLTIGPGAALSVGGTLTNTAGNTGLVIKNGGSLIHSTGGVAATTERAMPANSYRLVSAPVGNMQVSLSSWAPILPDTTFDLYWFNESVAQSAGNYFPWINIRAAGGGHNPLFGTTFVPGRGYLSRFDASGTKTFAGQLNVGNVDVAITRTNDGRLQDILGWNLIGNPYPSGYNWNGTNYSAILSDVYAYTLQGTTYVPVSAGTLAPNQGFFVNKKDDGGGTFTFLDSRRVHGGTFAKQNPVADRLVLAVSHGGLTDVATVQVKEGTTPNRDAWDALKIYSLDAGDRPQLFTQTANSVRVAINTLAQIESQSEILVGVDIPAAGQYTLSIDQSSGLFQTRPMYLKDMVTGLTHDLRQNPSVMFGAERGLNAGRFKLLFVQPTGVEPIANDATQVYVWNNLLTINFAQSHQNGALQVYDTGGRLVMSRQLGNQTSHTVPVNLQTGVYLVRITSTAGVFTQRIVVR